MWKGYCFCLVVLDLMDFSFSFFFFMERLAQRCVGELFRLDFLMFLWWGLDRCR